MRVERPPDAPALAAALAAATAARERVRPAGGGTKLDWGAPTPEPDVELRTGALDRILSYDPGDLTAVLQPGVTLAAARAEFATHGQALALDPPDAAGAATVGGVVASTDSGPWRHRHGSVRDLVLGVTVALADGSLARAGSRVIKNVAGYDLAKLYAGSFGTLGAIVEVVVRLHPRPEATATVVARGLEIGSLAAGAAALGAAPLELEALDVRWEPGGGAILARTGGRSAAALAERAAELLAGAGLEPEPAEPDDEALWGEQRDGQRPPPGGATVRVGARPSRLGRVLAAAEAAGAERAVGRAALGLTWLTFAPPRARPEALGELRERLAGYTVVLESAPAGLRGAVDPWGVSEGPALELMRRVKARFDPDRTCRPGVFAGGI